MKIYKLLSMKVLLLAVLATGAATVYAQKDKQAAIKKMIEARQYVFKAQTVLPLRGPARQLTTDYDLTVAKDTVASYLPYFGRAYVAPLDPSKGGLRFTSKDFDYSVRDLKKGGWDIMIRPRDIQEVEQLNLTVFDNGTASLQVTSTNRDPISFTGYVADSNRKR